MHFVILSDHCHSSTFQAQDNKDELKTKLKEILRDKSDVFNSKNAEEDKVKCTVLTVFFV